MRLLDTDHCIWILRGHTDIVARRRAVCDEVATTIITAAELYYGAAKSRNPSAGKATVDVFLRTLRVLGTDGVAAQYFGYFKALLESGGRRLADADLLIGSIARRTGATLVTGNTRHFERIPGLDFESWINP